MSLLKHKIVCEDGSVYYGYVNDQNEPEGEGTLTYTNGNVLEGTWHKGSPHGPGVIRKSRKDTSQYIEVTFDDGYMQGKIIFHFGQNTVEGTIKNGFFDDEGELQGLDYSDVKMTEYDSYSGRYNVYRGGMDRYFNKLGKGTLRFAEGFVHSGTWQYNGQYDHNIPLTSMSGHGKLVSPKGTVIEGEFRDDNPRGKCVIRFDDKTRRYGEQVFTGIMDENGLASADFSRCFIGRDLEDDDKYIARLYDQFRSLVMDQGTPENMGLDVTWDGELKTAVLLDGMTLWSDTRMTRLMDVVVDKSTGTGHLVTSNGKQYYEINPEGPGRWFIEETDHKYFSEQLVVQVGEGRYVVYFGHLFTPWEKVSNYVVEKDAFHTVIYIADNLRLVPKKQSRIRQAEPVPPAKKEMPAEKPVKPYTEHPKSEKLIDRFKALLEQNGLEYTKVSLHMYRITKCNIDFMEIREMLMFSDPEQGNKLLRTTVDEYEGMKYVRSL